MPVWIFIVYRIVVAISEHIAAEDVLPGGGEAVRVDEAADLRVVITALQVIESRLLSVGLAKDAKNGSILPGMRSGKNYHMQAQRQLLERPSGLPGVPLMT